MKSVLKKVLMGFLALLGAGILFLAIRYPRLDIGYVYHGHKYDFIGEKYGIPWNHLSAKKEKAVARFYDAVIYTLQDDPDEFYLSPRVFLPHLPYNVLVRCDGMQLPSKENVDHIDILSGAQSTWRTLEPSAQHALLEAYGKSTVDPKAYALKNMYAVKERWQAKADCEVLDVRIWFRKPNDLYYKLMVIQRGNEYDLLLEDGETLIGFDGSLLPQ